MSAHTPGPWMLAMHPGMPFIHANDNTESGIAEIFDSDFIDSDTKEANARLIAAAPDLLAALEQALAESGCDGDLCMHQWHDAARAATARARGGK